MRKAPARHQRYWGLAATLLGIFIMLWLVDDTDWLILAKLLTLGGSAVCICIGVYHRQRLADEDVFSLVLEERERRSRPSHRAG